MYKLFFGSTKIQWTTAGQTPSAIRPRTMTGRAWLSWEFCAVAGEWGRLTHWHMTLSRLVRTTHKRMKNLYSNGSSEKAKIPNVKVHEYQDSTTYGISVPDAEVSYTVKKLALQHFPASALSDMKTTFSVKKRLFHCFKMCSNIWTHSV